MRQRVHENPVATAVTAAIAGLGAVVFPAWWPSVEMLGLWFAPLVPIASVLWLGLQSINMILVWIERWRNRK